MAESIKALDGWVRQDHWPHVQCPVCRVGTLSPEKLEAVSSEKTSRTFRVTNNPVDLAGTFTGLLRCSFSRCNETVAIAGDYVVDPDVEEDGHTTEFDFFRLRFATPALDIIVPPKGTPDSVATAIKAADKLLWIDPSAAANRLRAAVEELLTVYGMPRFRVVNHKRKRLSTQERITEFKRDETTVGEALEAVKWIGNHGSHEDTLTVGDVLEGAEILAYALRIFYDRADEEIERKVKAVNRRRGLPRKSTRSTS